MAQESRSLWTSPITDLEHAKMYIRFLVDTDRAYHLEDDPFTVIWSDCEGPSVEQLGCMKERAADLYKIPRDAWGEDDCPIGYMMNYEAQKAGFSSWEEMREAS